MRFKILRLMDENIFETQNTLLLISTHQDEFKF